MVSSTWQCPMAVRQNRSSLVSGRQTDTTFAQDGKRPRTAGICYLSHTHARACLCHTSVRHEVGVELSPRHMYRAMLDGSARSESLVPRRCDSGVRSVVGVVAQLAAQAC
eukprot:3075589-Prymnesium_polylepis.1